MNHPDEALLLEALHEPAAMSSTLRTHLEQCAECRSRQAQLLAADEQVGSLLGALDHPLPAITPEEILSVRPRPLRRRALLVAELTLFLAAAAAAMTIPASPVHQLLFPTAVARAVSTLVDEPPVEPRAAVAPVGIALAAPDSLVVAFRQVQSTGSLEVRLTSDSQVTVSSRGGTVGYRVNEGRVEVDNRVPADGYVIEIPSSLSRAEIVMGRRVLFSKNHGVTTPAGPTDGVRYRITLADSTRNRP